MEFTLAAGTPLAGAGGLFAKGSEGLPGIRAGAGAKEMFAVVGAIRTEAGMGARMPDFDPVITVVLTSTTGPEKDLEPEITRGLFSGTATGTER